MPNGGLQCFQQFQQGRLVDSHRAKSSRELIRAFSLTFARWPSTSWTPPRSRPKTHHHRGRHPTQPLDNVGTRRHRHTGTRQDRDPTRVSNRLHQVTQHLRLHPGGLCACVDAKNLDCRLKSIETVDSTGELLTIDSVGKQLAEEVTEEIDVGTRRCRYMAGSHRRRFGM